MSHTTTLKSVAIRDISAFKSAVNELIAQGAKITLLENAVPRMYYEAQSREIGKCDYVIRVDSGPYDIGFKSDGNGNLTPMFDAFGGSIREQLGLRENDKTISNDEACISKLVTEYSKFAIMNEASLQGHIVESCTLDSTGNWQICVAVN